jgi:tetratricopeptide (TPR) repeat protein
MPPRAFRCALHLPAGHLLASASAAGLCSARYDRPDAMDRHRYQLIRRTFHEASERPSGERAAYLDQACAEDPELRAAVEALLADLDTDHTAGLRDQAGRAVLSALEPLPERLGPYRLLHVLGEGGMGVVYEAEQEQPRRRVAVKVVRPGLASETALQRFRDEASILGRLAHPGIAQVLQAGATTTAAGERPWIAMELVRGLPLSEHVARHAPDLATRVALLVSLCDAVAHAHRHGVVHRDLKPANVVVPTGEGEDPARVIDVKVLDFGIARLVGPEGEPTRHTAEGQLVGTLACMSPEQVRGDGRALDTRTDVWALGVTAYEVLSGRPPLDLSGCAVPEAARRITEQEPRPLGQHDRRLRGDLEAVVAKALEKDPARRYDGAAALGDDLRRVQRHEPVTARRLTALYQLGKLAQRHRALVAGALLAVGGLVVGLVVAWHQADVAERARQVAEHDARTARDVTRFMLESFRLADPGATLRRDVTIREALDIARTRLATTFAGDEDVLPAALASFARTYASVGSLEEALALAEQGVAAARAAHGPDAPRTHEALAALADVLGANERPRDAVPVWCELLGLDPDHEAARVDASGDDLRALDQRRGLGEDLALSGELTAGAAVLDAVAREVEARVADGAGGHADTDIGLDERRALEALAIDLAESRGHVARLRSDWAGAIALWQGALARRQERGDDRLLLAATRTEIALNQHRAGDLDGATATLRTALADTRAVLGDDHPLLAVRLTVLAELLSARSGWRDAVALHEEALAILEARVGAEHPSLSTIHNNLAVAFLGAGDRLRADEHVQRALDLAPADLRPLERATALHNRSDILAARGRPGEALAALEQSLQLLLATVGEDHAHVATTWNSMAGLLLDTGRSDEGIPLMEQVVDWRERKLGPAHLATIQAHGNLGWLLFRAGRTEDALPLLRSSLEGNLAGRGSDHPECAMSRRNLAVALISVGQAEEGLPLLETAADDFAATLGETHQETQVTRGWLSELRLALAEQGP